MTVLVVRDNGLISKRYSEALQRSVTLCASRPTNISQKEYLKVLQD